MRDKYRHMTDAQQREELKRLLEKVRGAGELERKAFLEEKYEEVEDHQEEVRQTIEDIYDLSGFNEP
jgi:hypothetical protein